MSYSFNKMQESGEIDLFGYLESCRYRFRLDTADLWNGTLRSLDDDYLKAVRNALDERQLTLVNLAVDGAHVWEDDPEKREQNYKNALAHLEAAEKLGAKTVRIDAGGGREQTEWTEEQFAYIVEHYQEYAKRALAGGYRVGPENHWGPEDMPENMKKLCEAVDSPAFGVLLHAGRWRGPSADDGDRLVAPWVMHTHLARNLGLEGIAEKMLMLRQVGYEGVYGIELVSNRYTEMELWLCQVRDTLAQWNEDS